MPLPAENVGSLLRPARLQATIQDYDARKITLQQLALKQHAARLDSITRMESTDAPTASDGEQRASTFVTEPLMDTSEDQGPAEHLAQDGQSFASKSQVK